MHYAIQLQWRTDVTISTTSLLRVMRPSITMSLRLSNGKTVQFELSAERFSELRYVQFTCNDCLCCTLPDSRCVSYQVARVLKEMQDLEKHPILNLKI